MLKARSIVTMVLLSVSKLFRVIDWARRRGEMIEPIINVYIVK